MRYLEKILQPGERVVFDGHLHWIIYRKAIFCLILTLIAGAAALYFRGTQYRFAVALALVAVFGILTLAFAFQAWWQRFSTEIAVTTARVIFKSGVIRRHTVEMNMDKVESVDVDQSLAGRILGYGTVDIRGTGASIEQLEHIAHPLALRNAITVR
ncbi:MAG TPA: PH domain-containing protein [Methylovirgula sp.]|nr:PH domain-containing protein [Methylovirgula sp.]